MKKVLFVIPPETEVEDLKQSGSKWPRLGIGYVAAWTRKSGAEVQILDCRAQELDHGAVAREIAEFSPDFVGLGPFTEEIYEAYKICQTAKRLNPGIKTVFGGPHVSALPRRALEEFPALDLVVYGEGEETFAEIVSGRPLKEIDGLGFRDATGYPIINKARRQIVDVDSLPYPAWDLFPLESYRGILTLHLREKIRKPLLELPILSSRGCPYQCTFCYKTYEGLRNRNPVNIIDELVYDMSTYGATEFFFAEGTFAASREQGMAICDEILRRGLGRKIRWIVQTRVTAVTEELLRKMKEAGCAQVEFGVETGDEEILEQSQKGIRIAQVKRAVQMTKEAGLAVGCYFIIGHPGETVASIRKTCRLAWKLDADLMNMAIMMPYPGTAVREMAEKGLADYRLLSNDWSEYTKQRGGPLELKNLPLKVLQRIQSREYLKYYMRPRKLKFILKALPLAKIKKILRSLVNAGV